jgi:mRNA interferase MazF
LFALPYHQSGKGYPFEVGLPDGHQMTGVVLSDQVKSFSWEGRKAEFVCAAPNGLADQVRAKIRALMRL